jgi:hypothetical protein
VEEVLPLGGHAADAGLDAVGEHAQHIGQEQLRDVVLVVGQVVVEGRAQLDVGVLQLDEHQRQAIHIEQHVRAAEAGLGGRARALNPKLADGEEVVLARVVEVDHLDAFPSRAALGVLELDPHAIADQPVQLPVGRHHGQGLTLVEKS